MEQKKFMLVLMLVAIVAGGMSLIAPWFTTVVDATDRSNPNNRVTIQNDYYGYQLVRTTTTRTPASTNVVTNIFANSNPNQRHGQAGVFESAVAVSVVVMALLGLGLLLEFVKSRAGSSSGLAKLLVHLAAVICLFNLISLPYAIASVTGEPIIASRTDVDPNSITQYYAFPGLALIALLGQFLVVGLMVYTYRYGMPSFARGRGGVAPAPVPGPATPQGYTPTTFVPPPPGDAGAPAPQAAPLNSPYAFQQAPRRSVTEDGRDVIPPAPPGA